MFFRFSWIFMWSGYLHLQSYKHIQSRFRLTLNINQMNMNESANRNEVYPHFHHHHSPEFSIFPSSFLMMVLCHSELHFNNLASAVKKNFLLWLYRYRYTVTHSHSQPTRLDFCISKFVFNLFYSISLILQAYGIIKLVCTRWSYFIIPED